MNERVRSFPFFADKTRHQDLLKRAAAQNPGFTNSVVITRPFLDWGLSVVPFIIKVGTRSADGEYLFLSCVLAIGSANSRNFSMAATSHSALQGSPLLGKPYCPHSRISKRPPTARSTFTTRSSLKTRSLPVPSAWLTMVRSLEGRWTANILKGVHGRRFETHQPIR